MRRIDESGECAVAMRVTFAGKAVANARLVEDTLFGDGFSDHEVECALLELGVAESLRRSEPGGELARSWSIGPQKTCGRAK